MCACTRTCIHVCVYVCVCVCLSVCVHVCFTVCICNFSRTLKVSYLFSFAFPESTTKTTSGMVIPVSAMLVARTIFLMPLGGTAKTRFWSSDESTEWSAKIWNLQPNTDHMLVNPEWHLQPNKYWSPQLTDHIWQISHQVTTADRPDCHNWQITPFDRSIIRSAKLADQITTADHIRSVYPRFLF